MKIFIANVDKYAGNVIGKVFSRSVVGSTRLEEDADDETEDNSADKQHFVVVGTQSTRDFVQPPHVQEIIQPASKDHLLASLMSCDVIIYDISESQDYIEEASWAVQSLHDNLSTFTSQKLFICISTALTWARTKPLNPDEPDVPFTEDDYRRRRTHPNFKEHIAAEKLVIKLGKTDKSKLLTYVVNSGLQYGCGEDIFHFLFKSAWLGDSSELPIFGDGQNVVPTIHIEDLSSILVNIADNKPKTKYIIAVDESNSTLEEIVKAISKNLGSGQVKRIPKEDSFLLPDLSQYHYDQLSVNLIMEATCIKETMKILWIAETGLVENIKTVITEFKQTRRLLPIKLCILGPPAAGKTTVAAQLCQYYKIHHVKMANVINEAVEKLQKTAARSDVMDDAEDDDGAAQDAVEYLEVLKDDKEENKGQYSSQHVLRFFKEKLNSMPCQNQGFVLDGFPKTEDEAKELFAPDDGDGNDDGDSNENYNTLLIPELVVSLDADNEFLKDRVINLPQSEVAGTHNTEEGLLRRLRTFRELNEEDITVLNYFDELEIHPLRISEKCLYYNNLFDVFTHTNRSS
jgi:adenylate kinase